MNNDLVRQITTLIIELVQRKDLDTLPLLEVIALAEKIIKLVQKAPKEPKDERQRIYVGGPLTTSGLMWHNIRNALIAADIIMEKGHIPFVPHLSALWAMSTRKGAQRSEPEWMRWCFDWLDSCDSMLRLPGISSGTDLEQARAEGDNKQVFFDSKSIPTVKKG